MKVLLYSSYTTIAGWGRVLLSYNSVLVVANYQKSSSEAERVTMTTHDREESMAARGTRLRRACLQWMEENLHHSM